MTYWERLDEVIKSRGLTRKLIADRVGITVGNFSSWKSRGDYPRADVLAKISAVLGVSVDYLVTGAEQETKGEIMNFWERLDVLIQCQGTSRKEVAEYAGIAVNTFSMWKSRRAYPNSKTASKIAEYLGVSIEDLLADREQETSSPYGEFWERTIQCLGDRGQQWLCDQIGLTPSTFSTWKTKGRIPRADKVAQIADVLGVTVEYLVTGADQCLGERGQQWPSEQIEVTSGLCDFVEEVRKDLQIRGKSFKWLADKAGLVPRTVQSWFSRGVEIKVTDAIKVCRVLGRTVEDIVGTDMSEPRSDKRKQLDHYLGELQDDDLEDFIAIAQIRVARGRSKSFRDAIVAKQDAG